jgi:hypothetical protein
MRDFFFSSLHALSCICTFFGGATPLSLPTYPLYKRMFLAHNSCSRCVWTSPSLLFFPSIQRRHSVGGGDIHIYLDIVRLQSPHTIHDTR